MVLMRATVLEMIFVGARVLRVTVLGEAMVLVEASVIVGATVLEARVFIGAKALKATVPMKIYGIIGVTVLGGRPRECG
jgi:hypothetical protein